MLTEKVACWNQAQSGCHAHDTTAPQLRDLLLAMIE
jgi:hypothetical protein